MASAKIEFGRVGKNHAKGWARFKEEAFKKYKKEALQIAKQGYCYYINYFVDPYEICKQEVDKVIIDEEQRDIAIRIGNMFLAVKWFSNKKEAIKAAKY